MSRIALMLVVCLLIARCAKSPSAPDDVYDPPGSATADDVAFCLSETNRYRAQQNRPALVHAIDLSDRAHAAAESDHASGRPHDYFRTHPFSGAENEVLYWSGSIRSVIGSAVAAYVSEGPQGGHWQNVMGNYTELGCGFATAGDSVTFVQNFR